MTIGRTMFGAVAALVLSSGAAWPEGPARFVVPRTRAEWESRRPKLIRAIDAAFGDRSPLRPGAIKGESEGLAERDGLRVERIRYEGALGRPVRGLFACPADTSARRLPGVIYMADGEDAALRPGLDGLDPALEIARRGMAVLWIEVEASPSPWVDPDRWPQILRDDRFSLEAIRKRPEVDPAKIAVLGVGLGGTRAVWLMALNDEIPVGVAIGGMTRLADYAAAHPGSKLPPWANKLVDGKDLDALVALCGGRHLQWTVGDRDPSCPPSGVAIVEAAGDAMERLADNDLGLHVTRLGRHDEHYNRLPWMGALEILDKAFFPQGPTPLGHSPEPEPPATADFVDLAPDGLAGWVVEMSQRPGTWTWTNGLIACKPGRDEYGWLRAPIEVDDFVLKVEWRVPEGGNSGIFLRARPVPWTFPPSSANKRIVSALGLDWPSRTGLELQAADDHGRADKYTSGSLYRHAAPAENPTNPAGQWNRYTVRARGPRVEVWNNGTQVLDTAIDRYPLTLANPPLRGYIGLQNHGSPGEFRNIRLRQLPRE